MNVAVEEFAFQACGFGPGAATGGSGKASSLRMASEEVFETVQGVIIPLDTCETPSHCNFLRPLGIFQFIWEYT